MAYFRIEYYSAALHRQTSFEVLIPNDMRPEDPRRQDEYHKRGMKTLFLLHGFTGKAGNWVPEWMAESYNFAIVMPSAENSFYLDNGATGRNYQTMVGVELVEYVRKTFGLAMKKEDTYIAGLSMGGFGAIHTALAYPDTFAGFGALSSALIVHEVASMQPGSDNGVANYQYYKEVFGEPATVLEREANPEFLVKKLKAEGKELPKAFMACGTEDFLIEPNRAFHRFLQDEGVEHEYLEGPGVHDMVFWNEYIQKYVKKVFA